MRSVLHKIKSWSARHYVKIIWCYLGAVLLTLTTGPDEAYVAITIDSGAHQHGHAAHFGLSLAVARQGCTSADWRRGRGKVGDSTWHDYYAGGVGGGGFGKSQDPVLGDHTTAPQDLFSLPVRGIPSKLETLVSQGTCSSGKPSAASRPHLKFLMIPS